MAKSIIMQVDEATAGVMEVIQREITGVISERLLQQEDLLEEIKSNSSDASSAMSKQRSVLENVDKKLGKLPEEIVEGLDGLFSSIKKNLDNTNGNIEKVNAISLTLDTEVKDVINDVNMVNSRLDTFQSELTTLKELKNNLAGLDGKIQELEKSQEGLKNTLKSVESKLDYLCLPFYKRWFKGVKNNV